MTAFARAKAGVQSLSTRQTACLLFLGSLVLGLAWLGRKSYWVDEIATLRISAQSLGALLAPSADPHPPLYYLLIHAWLAAGDGEFWVRLPSAIFAAASVAVVYGIGVVWGRPRVGVWAAVLLALSPLHLYYAQEARMYALAALLGTASLYFWSRGLEGARLADWAAFVAVTVLGLYTHYSVLAIFLLETVALIILWRVRRPKSDRLWAGFGAHGLVALGFAAWTPRLAMQLGRVNADNLLFVNIQRVLASSGLAVSAGVVRIAILVAGLVVLLGLAVAFYVMARWEGAGASRYRWLLGVVLLIAYLVSTLSMITTRGLSLKRQALVLWPVFLLILLWAILPLDGKARIRAGLLVVALPILVLNLLVLQKEDWRGAAGWIAAHREGAPTVAFYPPWFSQPFEHYYSGASSDIQLPFTSDSPSRLASLPDGQDVWLVTASPDTSPGAEAIQAWVQDQTPMPDSHAFAGIRVQHVLKGR